MAKESIDTHEDALDAICRELDIPKSLDQAARDRYASLGAFLEEHDATAGLQPLITPQGSFLLGTVVRPVSEEERYDLDLVCATSISKDETSMAELKRRIGSAVIDYAEQHGMTDPEEGRRCWKLLYARSARFHMDVLPAIPDPETHADMIARYGLEEAAYRLGLIASGLAMTDRKHSRYRDVQPSWPLTNPKGYASWFASRQVLALRREKERQVARGVYAKVEDVPDWRVKTPLQRVVQLLKRHRDVMFEADPDHKPISAIITTLAALAYAGEATITDAMKTIVQGMKNFIQPPGAAARVPNPINPSEDFADKWRDHPAKERNVHRWLISVQKDFSRFLDSPLHEVERTLGAALGPRTVGRVASNIKRSAAPVLPASPALALSEAERMRSQGLASRPYRA